MAFKKKSGLREKASKTSNLASKIDQFRRDQEQDADRPNENPLLKLSKISKKEKQQAKTSSFNERLASKVTFNLSGGISKSALRRRKRKEREQLKPKMEDLLSSLPESTVKFVDASDISRASYVKAKPEKHANLPNPQKHSGHTKLLQEENKHFSKVLQNEHFQQSPFAALRQAIAQNKQ